MAKKIGEDVKTSGLTCGLVMPISAMDGCTAEHWVEVKNIICEAVGDIEKLSFTTKLVSEQDDVGVIQKRIVQNVYSSDIVICDVSCKNANVMFELGMRLAFDKPTILIKDDKTDFSFDTGVIEHLLYPRDLRFSRMVSFKKTLAEKVVATYEAYTADSEHSTFLKNFGSFKIASLDQTVGTPDQVMLDMMQDLTREVARIGRKVGRDLPPPLSPHAFRSSEAYSLEWVEEVMSAAAKFKKLNPLLTWDGCRGNSAFYSFIFENCSSASTNYKSYEKFISSVDTFFNLNPQILE
ncbi:hypothetical protein PSCICG_15370 [Pseudomonas cichorii]|nr:hypothetical protein PSCICG_15370 [Pseudomonas cichorii]